MQLYSTVVLRLSALKPGHLGTQQNRLRPKE